MNSVESSGSWSRLIGAGFATAAVAGIVVLVIASQGGPVAASAASEFDADTWSDLAEVSESFENPQGSADLLPPRLVEEEVTSFVPSSSRSIGTFEETHFWVAANESGEVCLVLLDGDGWGAASCRPSGVVLKEGLSVQLLNEAEKDGGIRAHLIPRDFAVDGPTGSLEKVGGQLLVGRANAPADEVILRSSASTISLDSLQSVGE